MKEAKLGQFVFFKFFSKKVSCLPLRMNLLKDNMGIENKISVKEYIVLTVIAVMMLVGFVLVFTNVPQFERYTIEDGLVEWLTVIGLLLSAGTCFIRAIQLRSYRSGLFILGCILLGLVLFFAAVQQGHDNHIKTQ